MRTIKNIWFNFVGFVNQSMGRWFVRLHSGLVSLLLIGFLTDSLIQSITSHLTLEEFYQGFLKILFVWASSGVAFTVIWLIIQFFNVDLFLYYFIWIPFVVDNQLGEYYYRLSYKDRAGRTLARIRDIETSKRIHAEGYEKTDGSLPKPFPSFVKREHLSRKSFWPHWVFSIVTIFNERSLSVSVDESDGKKNWTLNVDLRDEAFGIYSNRGKRFLTSHYRSVIEDHQKISLQARNLFMPTAPVGIMPVIQGPSIPFRWASGGFLSVVYCEGKYWVPLFFRDIPPIGLNVANGASENKDEYKSLNRLITREFSEEMILLPAKPRIGTEWTQVLFHSIIPNAIGSMQQEYRASDFVCAHANLRRLHDKFNIFIPEENNPARRRLWSIDTPFRVKVTYHLADLTRENTDYPVEFIVPSINPREAGIETIWLCTFRMKKDEYLIDGEYDLARNYLIRQPIIMLDMDFLENLYKTAGSLGELINNQKGFDDDKLLPPIPGENFRLFDADVDFRKVRVRHLEQLLEAQNNVTAIQDEYELPSKKAQDALEKELPRIRQWLSDYEKAFTEAREGRILNDFRLRCLCPVTWKTLELIFAHDINYRRFS